MLSVSTVAEIIKCILSQLDRITKLEFKFQVAEPAQVLKVQPFDVMLKIISFPTIPLA